MLAADGRFAATLSLAGVTARPAPSPIPRRIGGFGGAAGLAAYLADHAIDRLVDATHPFAARITGNAHHAARLAGIGLLRLRRPEWIAAPGDDWRHAPDMSSAALLLGPAGRRVFLTVGRGDLAPFHAAPRHHYLARSIDPPMGLLPPHAVTILARGPYRFEDECDLLRQHRIEILVTKNSGGEATRAKLDAARALGLPVVMVARPAEPDCSLATDAAAALEWLGTGHEADRGA